MRIFYLLQQALLASTIARTFSAENHHHRPPKIKHASPHQETTLKEYPLAFTIAENHSMTTLNRAHENEYTTSSMHSRQLNQQINQTHQHRAVQHTKPHLLHKTRERHSKKISVSLRRPPTKTKAMAKPQLAMLSLHPSSMTSVPSLPPLVRSRRGNNKIGAAQWERDMGSITLPSNLKTLIKKIHNSMMLLENNPHEDNLASKLLRYSLLCYERKHVESFIEQSPPVLSLGRKPELHIAKSLLQQINTQLSIYERPVPQRLSMIWIGGITPILENYLYCIVSATLPGNVAVLLYDHDATLAAVLGKKIKEFSAHQKKDFVHPDFSLPNDIKKSQKNDLEQLVLALQNAAYTEIKKSMSQGLSFDSAAIDFMVENLGEEREALQELRYGHLRTYNELERRVRERCRQLGNQFTLKAITQDLFKLPGDSDAHLSMQRYNNYILEAGLRNNLAAASDLVRVFDLQQHGGVYRDIDLLPNVRDEVFSSDPTIKKDILDFVEMATKGFPKTEASLGPKDVLHGLQYEILWEALKLDLPFKEPEKAAPILSEEFSLSPHGQSLVERVQQAIQHYKTTHTDIKDFFVPLDQVKVGPAGIAMQGFYRDEKIIGVNNNIIAAQPHSIVLTQFISKLDDTYALLQQPGMGMQYPDLAPNDGQHNLDPTFSISEISRNEWRQTQWLAPLEEAEGSIHYLPVLPGLRLDGIASHSKATVLISGPTSLSNSINDYFETFINAEIRERVSSALRISPEITVEKFFNYAKALPHEIEGEYSAESFTSTWISDAGARQSNIADSTQYDHTLILQLQDDVQSNLAARFLNNKHPDKTTWLARSSTKAPHKMTIINRLPTRPSEANAKIRVIIIGHGETVDGKVKLANHDGKQLAHLLAYPIVKETFLAAEQNIARISLIGCNLAAEKSHDGDVSTNSFIIDLFNSLKKSGVSVKDITARRGPMRVSHHGKKMVQLTASPQSPPLWQHHDGKVIFTQDNKGIVHYQHQISYIDTPLPEPGFLLNSAGPLAWGTQSQRGMATQLATQFHQAVSKIKIEHRLDDEWIPLLHTLENTAEETKVQWLNTKDPSQGLRYTSAKDPIFSKIKTYADTRLAGLHKAYQWVDNKLIQKPPTRAPQQTSLFKTIERGANNLLAINTLINALRYPPQNAESILDKVLTVHSYLSITQATTTLTAEASHLFTRNLANKNSATTILAKAEQFGATINNAASRVFNIANLGFDVTELMLARGPEQARHFATQLGFDAGISASFAIEGIAETLGADAIASVAGPVGWALLAGELIILPLIGTHHAAPHTAQDVAIVNQHLTAMLEHYRAGGFHFSKKDKTLVPFRNVIIKKIDLKNGMATLKSPTLSRIENISVRDGMEIIAHRRVPLAFQTTFATVTDHDPPLSQYFHIPEQAAIQDLQQARIIVLPDTPETRFNYTITPYGLNGNRTNYNNAHLSQKLIGRPCQPCTTPYEKNLLSLWRRTRLTSLQPNYQSSGNTTVILDVYPRTLVVPPRYFNHSHMRYEMTGGGSTVTLIPQAETKFLFNAGTQISRWLIDARSFSISSLHCDPGCLRIDNAEFSLDPITNNDIFMLRTQFNDLLQINMRQGLYQYNVINMHGKPLVDVYERLKHLMRNKKLMPYVALANLPGSQQNTNKKTVGLFDARRQLLVSACVDGAVTVAGVGAKEQSHNPYFFAKTDGSILWRVNAKKQKIVKQWRPLFAEYQDMYITGVYQNNKMTFLEQQIPMRHSNTTSAFDSTIRLTSSINSNDALKCVEITFPANQLNNYLEILRTFLPTVATTHTSHRDELILFQILPVNDLTPRTEPIEKVDATQHLRPAGYARFIRLNDQENTKNAWLWLEKGRLIEPRCKLAGQILPNFVKLLSVGETEIPVGVTADDCHFRIHADDHIEFIGVLESWITAHWETLSTDLDHMAQQTTTAPFITLSGLIEETVQTDSKKSGKIISQRAWYDTEEKQFMIAPSHLNQTHLVYLGSDHSGGGWLYDHEQQHLYYTDLVNPSLLKTLFTSDLQAKTAHWQVSERLFSDQSIDNVKRQDDGRIVVCTSDGLIFLVDHHEEESGQGPLLLAVTSDWQKAHEETLTDDLHTLTLRYATNDKIEVVNTSNHLH